MNEWLETQRGKGGLARRWPPGTVILRRDDPAGRGAWLRLSRPCGILTARRAGEVPDLLREVEAQVARGRLAAGFVAYEAAPAFDPALAVAAPRPDAAGERSLAGRVPAAWFGLYDTARETARPPAARPPAAEAAVAWSAGPWRPSLSRAEHARAIARIKEWIAAGDTYQVNFTLRLRSRLRGDPWALFLRLQSRQRSRCSAYVDTGADVIVSASPELFFRLEGERIVARPMKGTAPRGRDAAEDRRHAAALRASEKERAENVMIVDMMRNDLGRIAVFGSVKVERLFTVERYPTVLQLTSTVAARTRATLAEIMAGLFPCASVTGAPKPATMRIIAELEGVPRGIYTGAIGFLAPGRQAQFNVAIRTVHADPASGDAEYGTGGGIVWDSTAAAEYAECLTKAEALRGA